MPKIGILALQGDFDKHVRIIRALGAEALLVKTKETLEQTDRLIIPGGESTTFLKLIDRLKLRDPLLDYCRKKPVFGTCAGLIILSTEVVNATFEPLKLIELKVERNAYGRQIDSFIANIELSINSEKSDFEAVFIRAPKILQCSGNTKPLALHNTDIVMARQNNILVATFHPELTEDYRIHKYFLNKFP